MVYFNVFLFTFFFCLVRRKDWIIRVTIFQLLRVFRFFFILLLAFRFSVGLTAANDPIVLKFCFAVHLG